MIKNASTMGSHHEKHFIFNEVCQWSGTPRPPRPAADRSLTLSTWCVSESMTKRGTGATCAGRRSECSWSTALWSATERVCIVSKSVLHTVHSVKKCLLRLAARGGVRSTGSAVLLKCQARQECVASCRCNTSPCRNHTSRRAPQCLRPCSQAQSRRLSFFCDPRCIVHVFRGASAPIAPAKELALECSAKDARKSKTKFEIDLISIIDITN